MDQIWTLNLCWVYIYGIRYVSFIYLTYNVFSFYYLGRLAAFKWSNFKNVGGYGRQGRLCYGEFNTMQVGVYVYIIVSLYIYVCVYVL
jgi:hypothetical protein